LAGAGRDDRRPLPQPQPAVSRVDGLGDIDGYEDLPANVQITNDPAKCTDLPASAADPLRHELQMTGVFDGRPGDGRATFTSGSPSYRNLEGTRDLSVVRICTLIRDWAPVAHCVITT